MVQEEMREQGTGQPIEEILPRVRKGKQGEVTIILAVR